jgi:hypothetical protein
MGNKMCPLLTCSCFPIRPQKDYDDEDNSTYTINKSNTEIHRTQFKSYASSNDLFTISDDTKLENSGNISTISNNTSVQISSFLNDLSGIQELDVNLFDTKLNMSNDDTISDSVSMDSGMYSTSSQSTQDVSAVVVSVVSSAEEKPSIKTSDLKFIFKKKRNQVVFKRVWSMNESSFLNKIKENVFHRAQECVSLNYLMFSNTNNNRTNQSNHHEENNVVNNDNNNNSTTVKVSNVLPDVVDLKAITSLLKNGVTPLCQFFLRIYDTNFF